MTSTPAAYGTSTSKKGYNETLTTPSDHKDSIVHSMTGIHGMFSGVKNGMRQMAEAIGDLHTKLDELHSRPERDSVAAPFPLASSQIAEQVAKHLTDKHLTDKHEKKLDPVDISNAVGPIISSAVSGSTTVLQTSMTHNSHKIDQLAVNIRDQRLYIATLSESTAKLLGAVNDLNNKYDARLSTIEKNQTEIINLLSSVNAGLAAQAARARAAETMSEPLSAPVSSLTSSRPASVHEDKVEGKVEGKVVEAEIKNEPSLKIVTDVKSESQADMSAVSSPVIVSDEPSVPIVKGDQPVVIKKTRKRAPKAK